MVWCQTIYMHKSITSVHLFINAMITKGMYTKVKLSDHVNLRYHVFSLILPLTSIRVVINTYIYVTEQLH